jgi:hypothetical protein
MKCCKMMAQYCICVCFIIYFEIMFYSTNNVQRQSYLTLSQRSFYIYLVFCHNNSYFWNLTQQRTVYVRISTPGLFVFRFICVCVWQQLHQLVVIGVVHTHTHTFIIIAQWSLCQTAKWMSSFLYLQMYFSYIRHCCFPLVIYFGRRKLLFVLEFYFIFLQILKIF